MDIDDEANAKTFVKLANRGRGEYHNCALSSKECFEQHGITNVIGRRHDEIHELEMIMRLSECWRRLYHSIKK